MIMQYALHFKDVNFEDATFESFNLLISKNKFGCVRIASFEIVLGC